VPHISSTALYAHTQSTDLTIIRHAIDQAADSDRQSFFGQKLILRLLATITLEVILFSAFSPFPALLPFFKCILEVMFSESVQQRLRFCLAHINCVKMMIGSLSVLSSIGKTEK
jgi:hypothetical protein